MKWSVIKRKLARVDKALDKSIDEAQTPGAVVLARMPREEEVIEHLSIRGHAVVRPERIPMTRDTIFDLASLTKPLATTTALMLLVEEGAVALDDPVAKVLPSFADRGKEEVSFRQLLTHSSGLKPWRAFHELLIQKERKTGERFMGTPEGREWIIDRVLRSALVHEPGQAAVYGDLDFIVLGVAVEALTKQPLDVFCEERVFGPLGMKDTRFFPLPPDGAEGHSSVPPALRRRVAATENCPWRDRILWGEVHDPNASAMGGVAGHAGLFSTADDIMRFARVFLDVWHGRSDLLPREQVLRFSERQRLPEDSDWAIGWDTPTTGQSSSGKHFSERSVGHLGFTGTSLWIDLEREAVVVMLTNRVHLVAKRSRFDLRPTVHDHILDAFQAG
ncbi:MAG: beta-lactamase family protein [Deltaproteobacteria bacterium]|nr:beta-lactamase family protein [Deltaproteobacteria bacterium]MBW2419092.1 beta-lactamase family protein [Deltaproteobacteria bacterium]